MPERIEPDVFREHEGVWRETSLVAQNLHDRRRHRHFAVDLAFGPGLQLLRLGTPILVDRDEDALKINQRATPDSPFRLQASRFARPDVARPKTGETYVRSRYSTRTCGVMIPVSAMYDHRV